MLTGRCILMDTVTAMMKHDAMKFKELHEKKFDNRRGYYGMIGDRTVIKNCRIIKDVNIGSDAYIKGANKLKNLTINSVRRRHYTDR